MAILGACEVGARSCGAVRAFLCVLICGSTQADGEVGRHGAGEIGPVRPGKEIGHAVLAQRSQIAVLYTLGDDRHDMIAVDGTRCSPR